MKRFKKWVRILLLLAMMSCGLTVAATAVVPINAQAATVKINKKKLTLNKGKTYRLKISGTKKKTTWKSSDPSVARVNSAGKVTAKKAGKAKITAKVNRKKYVCNITVEAPKISQREVSLETGDTCQLKMSGTKQKPVWTSANKTVAMVNAKGEVSAKNAGKAKISAKVNGDKFTCTIIVNAKKPEESEKPEEPEGYVDVSSVSVQSSLGINVGETATLIATVFPSNATDKSLTWRSDDDKIATVRDGIVTGVKAGITKIYVKAGKKEDYCYVYVREVEEPEGYVDVSSVSIQSSLDVNVGETATLVATVSPPNATDKSLTWRSDDDKIATVRNGVVIGVSSGSTKIYVKAGNKEDYCYVYVKEVEVTSISVSEMQKTILVNESFDLIATIQPDNATNKEVIWSSSDMKVATVENGHVTGISSGTAEITAKSGWRNASCKVMVNEPVHSIGEEWKVDQQWRFTINSVSNHYRCNSVSDKTGAQVVTIEYTYYNDGYTDNFQDLFFSSMNMNVYDENGTAADTYPCTHDKLPKVCGVGTNCTATETFILKNESSHIRVDIEKYTANGNGKKRVTYDLRTGSSGHQEDSPAVSNDYRANAELVKKYIEQNGETSSDGMKYITMPLSTSEMGTTIAYMPQTDQLVFTYAADMEGFNNQAFVFYSIADTCVTQVRYTSTYKPFDYLYEYYYEAISDMAIHTFSKNTNLTFVATKGDPCQHQTYASFQSECNQAIQYTMLGANTTLLVKMNISLKDLGFESYAK